jgi:CYTH domain-containing protein
VHTSEHHTCKEIPVIVITGGPCSGKTTAAPFLTEKLLDAGLYPIVVPEAATLIMGGNVSPTNGRFHNDHFQERIIGMTIALEREFMAAAHAVEHPRPVLLCDRGIMDALAYTKPDLFWKTCRTFGLNIASARDRRYHGIVHLRSAAIGAEQFYTKENNLYRRETAEEARMLDDRTLEAWRGHSHIALIGNEGITFAQKLQRLYQAVCRTIGIPVPLEIEEKYVIEPLDLVALGIPYTTIDIEQIYLMEPHDKGGELRIRRRGQDGAFTYYETYKREVVGQPGVRVETERFITEREYEWSARFRKPRTLPIRKKRHCFVYKDQYFELDVLAEPHAGLHLLEIECTEQNMHVDLPPAIKVIQRVTGDRQFSNASLARVA